MSGEMEKLKWYLPSNYVQYDFTRSDPLPMSCCLGLMGHVISSSPMRAITPILTYANPFYGFLGQG